MMDSLVTGRGGMTTQLRERLQSTLGGAYALERELGGGGMSRVFVATETALGRRVVVKVLPPETAAGVSAERFAREIQLAARLQHPHIVPLLAAGSAGGVLYYTMPLVEGESLRAHLRRSGALPAAAVVPVLRDVVRALAYAHRQGVVHRDVKPDNVLLSDGTALVTDFGVARALGEALEPSPLWEDPSELDVADDRTGLTSTDVMIGTPAYVAPEQATGDSGADHRVDLYALGAMAYELLTGTPPFAGRSPRAMVTAHMTEAPRPVDDVRADVPPALAALVMACLAKRPGDRPQGAEEVLRALDAAGTAGNGPLRRWGRLARRAVRTRIAVPTRLAALAAASFASAVALVPAAERETLITLVTCSAVELAEGVVVAQATTRAGGAAPSALRVLAAGRVATGLLQLGMLDVRRAPAPGARSRPPRNLLQSGRPGCYRPSGIPWERQRVP